MKKGILALLIMAAGSFAVAGGDLMPSAAGDNAKKQCDAGDVYIDHESNLMWQDAPYGDLEDGALRHNRSAGKAGRWRYAKSYCSSLIYAGFDDWRLPKIDEWVDLYDKTIKFKHTIDVDFWSSTPSKGQNYWTIYPIITGQPYEHKRSDTHYIRCVRCLD